MKAYGVYVRRHLTFDAEFHRQDSLRDLVQVKGVLALMSNKVSASESLSTDLRHYF